MVAVLVERDGAVRVLEVDHPGPKRWNEAIEDRGTVFEYESTEMTWDGEWARFYREKS